MAKGGGTGQGATTPGRKGAGKSMTMGRQISKPSNSEASPDLSSKMKRSPPQTSRDESKIESKAAESNQLNTEDSIFEKVDSNSQMPDKDGTKTPADARRGSNMTGAVNKRSTLSKNTTPNKQPLDNQEASMLIEEKEEGAEKKGKKDDEDGRASSMESSMSRQSRMRVQRVTPKSTK